VFNIIQLSILGTYKKHTSNSKYIKNTDVDNYSLTGSLIAVDRYS